MFEFDDDTHPLSTPSAKPLKNTVYINVVEGRAIVSKYTQRLQEVWGWQPCRNCEELEPEAMAAIEAVTRGMVRQTYYACPLEISERAIWEHGVELTPAARKQPIRLKNIG